MQWWWLTATCREWPRARCRRRISRLCRRLAWPLPPHEQNLSVTLRRPGEKEIAETLDVTYIGLEQRGVILSELGQRGIYRVNGFRPLATGQSAAAGDKPAWDVALAINGQADESD